MAGKKTKHDKRALYAALDEIENLVAGRGDARLLAEVKAWRVALVFNVPASEESRATMAAHFDDLRARATAGETREAV